MTELTDEKLAELREVAAKWPVLAALLDERDRLARDAERWHLAYIGESIRHVKEAMMSELVTGEVVETAAKARWDHERVESGDTTEWDMRYPSFREFDSEAMRAALEAVAPLIAAKALEVAAEAAARTSDGYGWVGDSVRDWLRARADIERGES